MSLPQRATNMIQLVVPNNMGSIGIAPSGESSFSSVPVGAALSGLPPIPTLNMNPITPMTLSSMPQLGNMSGIDSTPDKEKTKRDSESDDENKKGKKRKKTRTGSTASETSDARRESHKVIEQKRRQKINEKINELRELLNYPDGSQNKALVLQAAVENLKSLKVVCSKLLCNQKALQEEYMHLLGENDRLRKVIQNANLGRLPPHPNMAPQLAAAALEKELQDDPGLLQIGGSKGNPTLLSPLTPNTNFTTSNFATGLGAPISLPGVIGFNATTLPGSQAERNTRGAPPEEQNMGAVMNFSVDEASIPSILTQFGNAFSANMANQHQQRNSLFIPASPVQTLSNGSQMISTPFVSHVQVYSATPINPPSTNQEDKS